MDADVSAGPLAGARVIELGGEIAGPFVGMLLRSSGAEVIRIETPDAGQTLLSDATRRYLRVLDSWLHRGKRRLAFRSAEAARRYVDPLIASAHVVVDELDPASRRAFGRVPPFVPERPWILLTPFGAGMWDREGSDVTLGALSGAMWAIGEPEREPLTLPHSQIAVHAGSVAAMLAAAAIGDDPPRLIDLAVLDVTAAYAHMNALIFRWDREGHRAAGSGGAYPYTILPCKDGYVCIAVRTNAEWRKVVELLGSPDWSARPEFADVRVMADRHADAADELVMKSLAALTKDEILARASRLGVPVAPVRSVAEVAADPDLRRARTVVTEHAGDVDAAVPAFPWFGDPKSGTADPGADNEKIAAELGALGVRVDPADLWKPA